MEYRRALRLASCVLVPILFVLVFVIIFGCAKKEAKEVRIGAIVPMTGDNAVYGVALKKGMDLAIDELNTKGGINGKKLVVVYEDDQADPQKGLSAFNKLTKIDKVPMVIGAMFSAGTLAIAPVAERERIVLLSPTSSAVDITRAGDYVFRIYPSDAYDGRFLADFVARELKARTASILYIQVASVSSIVQVFRERFQELGGQILSEDNYAEGTTDFRTQLAKIKHLNPDIVFLPGYLREMAIQLVQAKELGGLKPILTISTFYDDKIFDLAKGAAEGVLFSTPFFDPQSQYTVVKTFVDTFVQKYDQAPNIWAGYGYDVINVSALALRNGGLKSDKIKEALYATKEFPGVTGKTSFDENGDVVKELRVMRVVGNRFVPYR
jgi:branched-chain amino acid transport system substrate-binding protein